MGGAMKNNITLHETLSGKLKRKQSSLEPFAIWISFGAYYPSEYLNPYIMEFLGSYTVIFLSTQRKLYCSNSSKKVIEIALKG